jgi:hypothetical protein
MRGGSHPARSRAYSSRERRRCSSVCPRGCGDSRRRGSRSVGIRSKSRDATASPGAAHAVAFNPCAVAILKAKVAASVRLGVLVVLAQFVLVIARVITGAS